MNATPDLIDQLADELTRAFRRLRRGQRKELAPFGLTFGQARGLRMIASSPGGVRIGELAGMLEIVPRSATTMVDNLENAGLVSRRPDPADRRSVLVISTSEGQTLLDRLAEEQRTSAERLFAPLSPQESEELLRLLQATREDLS